jgi:hypothetical protein
MHSDEMYKGRSISADTYKRGKGWGWSYQIDAGEIRESRDRPLRREESALSEAMSEAKAEIDMGSK